jgi:hypothetical protein
MKTRIRLSAILLFSFISISSYSQSKIESRNDSLFYNNRPIQLGMVMKLGEPDKNTYSFVEFGYTTSLVKVKAEVGESRFLEVKVSNIKIKNNVYSIRCVPVKAKPGEKGLNGLTYYITDLGAALDSKELLFADN